VTAVSAHGVERLPFSLPEFVRISWVNDEARAVWEERISAVARAWAEIEWRAVAAGARRCAIVRPTPSQFLEQAPRWVEAGLASLPVELIGDPGPYSSAASPAKAGEPFLMLLVLGSLDDVREFRHAWEASDQERIGTLLGYPPCCREFFRQVWVELGMTDTTWPMAMNSVHEREGQREVVVDGPPQANILWRWMGVRAVPHLPCSFRCAETVEFADRLIDVGRGCGYGAEMDWMLEILDWSVQWSALHGIAEIKTPVLKVSARTDATPVDYVVRRPGGSRPREGARGLGFPYRPIRSRRLSESSGYKRGLEVEAAQPDDGDLSPA
jgi:hypothetical protein